MSQSKSNAPHISTCPSSSRSPSFSAATFTSSTTTTISPSTFFSRASSPTRVQLNHHRTQSSSSVRLSLDNRSISLNRSVFIAAQKTAPPKKPCTCSPTTHPGSFRCAFHRKIEASTKNAASYQNSSAAAAKSSTSRALNIRRSAMKKLLVRIGGVEGELVKRWLWALIRPSSHHQRRGAAFQPKPSRLSGMSKAEEAGGFGIESDGLSRID